MVERTQFGTEDMSAKLYVGNLSFATTENDLQDLFAQVGTVLEVKLIQDRDTGNSRGFGFVTMNSQEEANSAISRFNGFSLGNRALTVNEARPQESRSDRPSGHKDSRKDSGRGRNFRRR